MATQRVKSSGYLGIGLAIATGLATILGSSLQAKAQVNPNIQTQLNIVSPPISAQIPNANAAPPTAQFFVEGRKGKGQCYLPSEPVTQAIANFKKKSPIDVTMEDVEVEIKKFDDRKPNAFQQNFRLRKAAAAFVRPNPNCLTRQPGTVTINFPLNPTYETDILKSGNNSSPGGSAGFGGNVLITTGVEGRPWDLVALSGAEASARYTPNFSPSFDSLTSQAAYQMFLYAYGYDPDTKSPANNLIPGSPNLPPTGMITFETLIFGYQNQTAFAPTFKAEKADLMTPQASYSIQNISLDDPNSKPCGAVTNGLNGTVIDSRSFCHYANFSITAGQTFSDVKTLQNFNVAASASVSWKIDPTLTLSLPASATAKDFQDVVGGRRDLLLQIGPVLTYTSPQVPICTPKQIQDIDICPGENANFTLSLPVTYYRNYSTVSADAWSGWVIMPTLTIAFSYVPAAKPVQ
jgi:hypothetical protein